jgi:hypothetical protein
VDRIAFATVDPMMQKGLEFVVEFYLLMLRLSLLFECFVFVFGFARSNVGVSSCFRVICYLFLVVRAIVLLL